MLQVYGIRHHGPGSAKATIAAFKEFLPDIVLVEGPHDANPLIPFINDPDLSPPVAGLVYNGKDLHEAHYLPFATFSPEFQAIKWALKKNIPARFIDLPIGQQITLEKTDEKQLPVFKQSGTEDDEISADPLGYLAKIAGYDDRERWWEVNFEQEDHPAEVFKAILELMKHLREEAARKETVETLIREAFMREKIRLARKEGYEKIAVICGAWHASVLDGIDEFKASDDKKIVKGIPKIKCVCTWIPWTYTQLSTQAGYGAGVKSPEWYHLLFKNRKEAAIRWLTKAGRLLRKKDLTTSSAHIIESIRLADSLAQLRGLTIPGLAELEEAAIATFCDGKSEPLNLVREQLVIGNRIGKVPKSIPTIPFQKDLEKLIKSCRLSKYKETNEAHWLKGTADKPKGGIDLREDNDLKKSLLLHRMNILDIPWGSYQSASEKDMGGFKEYWKLKWKANFAMRIIEAGMWGNTVEQAAKKYIDHQSKTKHGLNDIASLLQQALLAQVPGTIENLTTRLATVATTTKDIPLLIQALEPMIQSLRYGNSRMMDMRDLEAVIIGVAPRICIGLPTACQGLDEEASEALQQEIFAANQAIRLLDDEELWQLWLDALEKIARGVHTSALLRGFATRLLYDFQRILLEEAATELHYGLSKAADKQEAAQWIEGFLFGSGQLLIHQPGLWSIIDVWLNGLVEDDFKEILPLLRRAFSEFSDSERGRMLDLVRNPRTGMEESQEVELDAEQAGAAMDFLEGLG